MKLNLHIRELRKERGLTLAQLAEMIGTSVSHLSEIERGLKNVNNHLIERLAVALGTSSAALMSLAGGEKVARLNAIASNLDESRLEQLMAFGEALQSSAEVQKRSG